MWCTIVQSRSISAIIWRRNESEKTCGSILIVCIQEIYNYHLIMCVNRVEIKLIESAYRRINHPL